MIIVHRECYICNTLIAQWNIPSVYIYCTIANTECIWIQFKQLKWQGFNISALNRVSTNVPTIFLIFQQLLERHITDALYFSTVQSTCHKPINKRLTLNLHQLEWYHIFQQISPPCTHLFTFVFGQYIVYFLAVWLCAWKCAKKRKSAIFIILNRYI